MRATRYILAAAMALSMAAPAAAQSQDVDLASADGTALKATYMSPGQPGPAMLLVHQCNMDRTSWSGIASQLVDAGVHVLTLDLRGFGDSGGPPLREIGFPAFMQQAPGDVDVAFDYLARAGGRRRGARGSGRRELRRDADGGSRGAPRRRGVDAAVRSAERGRRRQHGVVVRSRGVRRGGDRRHGDARRGRRAAGCGRRLRLIRTPPRRSTTAPEHGLPMFDKNPDLEPALVAWLKAELLQ